MTQHTSPAAVRAAARAAFNAGKSHHANPYAHSDPRRRDWETEYDKAVKEYRAKRED